MRKADLTAFDEAPRARLETLINAARVHKTERILRHKLVVAGFWGFGPTPKRDALLRCMRYAFRTSRVFCANVDKERFEGLMCVYEAQLPLLETILDEAGMSAGGVQVGSFTRGVCMRCVKQIESTFWISLSRIEAGGDKTGRHPVRWGPDFKNYVISARQEEAVVKTTGLAYEPNNMIMLFMSARASHFCVEKQRARIQQLQRLYNSLYTQHSTWEVVARENNRILFEVQQAYTSGHINTSTFARIAFG